MTQLGINRVDFWIQWLRLATKSYLFIRQAFCVTIVGIKQQGVYLKLDIWLQHGPTLHQTGPLCDTSSKTVGESQRWRVHPQLSSLLSGVLIKRLAWRKASSMLCFFSQTRVSNLKPDLEHTAFLYIIDGLFLAWRAEQSTHFCVCVIRIGESCFCVQQVTTFSVTQGGALKWEGCSYYV